MFLVLWEYDVKPGSKEVFESIYGPKGEWAHLFRRDSDYQRTLLLRDPIRGRTYLTCDFWKTREAYKAFLVANSDAYLALDKRCEELTLGEREIGTFKRIAIDV